MSHRARVLVVDSDLDALYYVDDVLAELGYYPIKATCMEDAADIIGAMCLDAVVVNMAMIAGASESSLTQLEKARDNTAVLVMSQPGLQPDGEASPLRRFVEHPPATDELAQALEACGSAPSRSGR
jgi:DNA-binding NtrC family response regulator